MEILPEDLAWSLSPIGPAESSEYPCENQAMAGAVAKRRNEFFAGRRNARRALARLGVSRTGIGVGPHRCPVWPPGITGSISHSGAFCLAVVARSDAFASLGVDIEIFSPLDAELLPMVCRPEELEHAARCGADALLHGKTVFCLKEAFYKCTFPQEGRFLDFLDVLVTHREADPPDQAVRRVQATIADTGWSADGTYGIARPDFVAAFFARRPEMSPRGT